MGAIGDSLSVKARSGRRFTVTESLARGEGEAEGTIGEDRKVLRKAQLRAESRIRNSWRGVTAELNRYRRNIEGRQGYTGKFTAEETAGLRKLSRSLTLEATKLSGAIITDGIEAAVRREVKAQLKGLSEYGYFASKDVIDSLISKSTKHVVDTPFPGTSLNLKQRLQKYMGRALRVMEPFITAISSSARTAALNKTRAQLHDTPNKRTTVEGGSLSKNMARLNRTEQARAAQDAAIALMERMGIAYAYWRLSPAHPWYGGKEVCEKLAASTGPGVNSALVAEKDARSADVSQKGLYLLADFPRVPHPNCMCTQIPLVFDKPTPTYIQ